jgi:hypothetical protein
MYRLSVDEAVASVGPIGVHSPSPTADSALGHRQRRQRHLGQLNVPISPTRLGSGSPDREMIGSAASRGSRVDPGIDEKFGLPRQTPCGEATRVS